MRHRSEIGYFLRVSSASNLSCLSPDLVMSQRLKGLYWVEAVAKKSKTKLRFTVRSSAGLCQHLDGWAGEIEVALLLDNAIRWILWAAPLWWRAF